MSRRIAIALAAVLGLGLLAVPNQALAAPPPLFAKGAVVDRTVQPGSQVILTYVPPNQGEDRTGQVLPTIVLASTMANAKGRFSLGLQPSAQLLGELAFNTMTANFDLSTITPAGVSTSVPVTRFWNGQKWAEVDGHPEGSPSQDVTTVVERNAKGKLVNAQQVPVGSIGTDSPPSTCNVYIDYVSQDSTRIMSFHNAPNTTGTWTYGQTSDTWTDQGIEYGGVGPWSINGTRHISTSTSATIARTTGARYDSYTRTDFENEHRRNGNEGVHCPFGYGTKQVITSRWTGGVADDGPYPIKNCVGNQYSKHYAKASTATFDKTTASRIGFAVDVGPVNYGATSGYSTLVTMAWYARNSGMVLCGTKDVPNGDFGVMYVQNG